MRRALTGSLIVHAVAIGAAFAGWQWPEPEDAPAAGAVTVALVALATVSDNETAMVESSAVQALASAGAAVSVPLTSETIEPVEPIEETALPPPVETATPETVEPSPPTETPPPAPVLEAKPVAASLLAAIVPRVLTQAGAPVPAPTLDPVEMMTATAAPALEPVSTEDLKVAPVPQTLTIARRSEPTYPQPRRETPQQQPRREPPTQAGNGGQSNADAVASRPSAGQQGTAGAGGSAEVARYPSQILSKLRRALRYPSGAGGAGGEVLVAFTVAANGSAGGIGIARSSGNTVIDHAALETVRRAAPFPPIPAGAGRQSWTFTVPLAFVH